MTEFNIQADLVVKSDAVAAIGIVRRQGLGRVRHLAVADLWVQQKAKEKEVQYLKLEGTRNTSDILTKVVERDTIDKHMAALDLQFKGGRHPATPVYTKLEGEALVEEEWDQDGSAEVQEKKSQK